MNEKAQKEKCWFTQHLPFILLICSLIALLLGTIGFCSYYSNHGVSSGAVFLIALYNAIRLFTLSIDSEFNEPACVGTQVFWLLLLARFLAFLPVAGTVFAIFKVLLPKVISRIKFGFWHFRRNRLLLIGNNPENIRLYHSATNSKDVLLLSESDKDTIHLRTKNIRYYTPESAYVDAVENSASEEVLAKQLNDVLQGKMKTLRVIINTHDNALNLRLCYRVADCIHNAIDRDIAKVKWLENEIKREDIGADKRNKQLQTLVTLRRSIVDKLERVSVFAFGEREHERIYRTLEDEAVGVLHNTSRYHLASFEFLSEHPITEFLTIGDAELLTPNGCVDKDAEFNMLMIGFGNTNREIFLDAFSTFSFIVQKPNSIPSLKSVNYHIFDNRKGVNHDKVLNHTVYRFLEDFRNALETGELNEDDYLDTLMTFPFPSVPQFHLSDFDNKSFYNKIKAICLKNKKSVNYLLIAVGDDFNNIDLAQRLSEKKNEWELTNLYIFAKVRNKRNEAVVFSEDGVKEKPFYTYGNEDFTLDRVLHNEIEAMAHHRKRITQNVESTEQDCPNHMTDDTIKALYSWYTMAYDQRRSNLYNLLGLRMKLNLLGLDYKPKHEADKALTLKTEEEYFKCYAAKCRMTKSQSSTYRGARYSYEKSTSITDFEKDWPRMNLAVQEHYRWNAYMISCGFIPATRAQIKDGKTKSYVGTRYHANLSSFEALFKFPELSGKEDVIPYDYKLLDEAYYFLNTPDTVTGRQYRIVQRGRG